MQKIDYYSAEEAEYQLSLFPPRANGPLVVESLIGEGTETLTKRHFVKVNESLFVNEIKKRPILYNVQHQDYKRITLRNEAWHDVAMIMNLSVQECKKRWRSMRDAFQKNLRNKGEEERKSWIHYRLLEFLLPYTRTVGYVKGQHKTSSDYNEFNENSDDFDYLGLENDLDMYGNGPVTVSYCNEDGKELFRILHRPSGTALAESDIEEDDEPEDLDEIEAGRQLTSLLRPLGGPTVVDEGKRQQQQQQLLLQQQQEQQQQHQIVESQDTDYLITCDPEEVSESEFIQDEERHDSTMLNFCNENDVNQTNGMDQAWKRESIEVCYDSPDENPEHTQPFVTKSARKRQKLEPEEMSAQGNIKLEISDTLPAYRASEMTSVPASPTVIQQQSQAPSTPPSSYSTPQRDEEPRSQGSKESDARLGITDPDERFLMSCAPILRRLPNKKNLLARLRIQQMLYELEYDEKYDGT